MSFKLAALLVACCAVGALAVAESGEHVRDKRRLPDPREVPGFIVPATPSGFTKKQPSQDERSDPAETPAPAEPGHPAALAERKMSTSSSSWAPSSGASSRSPSSASNPSSPTFGGRYGSVMDSGSAMSQPRQKKAPQGREEHVRALTSFLDQTRKLGVPDEQALKLLDKELAKAKRQQMAPPPQRLVYHATPLKPYGALLNFNQAPYEKHQLKEMKPIQEQQNDIPPPSKPIVVESDGQRQSVPGKTEAVSVPSGPLPVSVPMLDQVQLLQTSQPPKHSQFFYPGVQSLTAAIAHPHQGHQAHQPHQAYQTISLPVQSYQHIESQSAVEQHMDNPEVPVSLESLHAYGQQEQEQHIQQSFVPIPSQPIASHPQPVYVYQQQEEPEVKAPPPQAEVHVELPSTVVTKQVEGHEADQHNGLYDEHQEYASQYRFGYRVRDEHAGNDFGHAETREGKMTKGEYFVTLPDGRLQSVKYWADPSGYHAHISYTNHAAHPGHATPGH